ncbi:MAG TPA: 16S rRNA (adenine(1518)-N(6)/adenine(1519)-N(6))-dimethyltransferase RsmA [Acidobacteriaceae bacterium]|nr:16S rRNA (adenine(1518)-N(6)/adenine(1519)-N(6))-dimethyltransferase RsmA [Acidobacteriaceae bacterium]
MTPNKPKLGQNFLVDADARQRIVDALGPLSTSTVLEIGPGRGALTNLLVPRAHRLIAVELDRVLAPRLAETWKHANHVEIHAGDILEMELNSLSSAEPLVVVGNLPYYITSDILLHLFAHASAIRRAVLMVQEEVADRLAAQSGTSAYGVLSATAQMHARIEKLFVLPPGAFAPAPNVNSAVVRLEMQSRFEALRVERIAFMRFLQLCFGQKRKTLANNLKREFPQTSVQAAIEEIGLSASVRAEAVPLQETAQLFRRLQGLA